MARAAKIETVIKNYGIMWRRDRVFWGSGNHRGKFEGRRSARIIDFRDQIGVYVLCDEARRPIYVGQAGQVSHPTCKPRCAETSVGSRPNPPKLF